MRIGAMVNGDPLTFGGIDHKKAKDKEKKGGIKTPWSTWSCRDTIIEFNNITRLATRSTESPNSLHGYLKSVKGKHGSKKQAESQSQGKWQASTRAGIIEANWQTPIACRKSRGHVGSTSLLGGHPREEETGD